MARETFNLLLIIIFALINGLFIGHCFPLTINSICNNFEAGRKRTALLTVWSIGFLLYLIFAAFGSDSLAQAITNKIYS